MTKARIPQPNPLAVVDDQAQHAAPFYEKHRAGFDDPVRIPTQAVASSLFDLGRSLVIPADMAYLLGIETQASDHDHSFEVPSAKDVPSGETTEINPLDVLRSNSSCARAGSRIIIAKAPPAEVRGDLQVMYDQDALLRSVDPAPFALVADGSNATTSPLPLHDARFDWAAVPNYAFRTTITRADRRAVGGDGLRAAAMIAILRGLGELADKLVLNTILAVTPATFTFGLAAARHAKFDELRALVGTAGAGAEIAGDGTFRAAGVFAELTAASDKTVVGLFNRSAIAFRPELAVHARRLNTNGDVELTVFANAQAVVSNPADFWMAA